jgi:hypothetical protein
MFILEQNHINSVKVTKCAQFVWNTQLHTVAWVGKDHPTCEQLIADQICVLYSCPNDEAGWCSEEGQITSTAQILGKLCFSDTHL